VTVIRYTAHGFHPERRGAYRLPAWLWRVRCWLDR
jgi:hypothetical protein